MATDGMTPRRTSTSPKRNRRSGHVEPARRLGFGTLIAFFGLTFGLTWGLAALLFLFPDQLTRLFGEVSYTNPLFILAVYAPGIAGVLLVALRTGTRGLAAYVRRLTLWRMPAPWWLFLALGIPALFYLSAAIKGSVSDPFPFQPWYGILPALLLALFIGPIEEFGWRGLALPLLQRRLAPFWASLVLGAVWSLWHVPAFLIGGTPQSNWAFVPYFVGVVAISVILTPMFNAARGSLLIAVLLHFQMNNPAWPDAQPWDSLVFVVVAIVVVWLNRNTLFRRGAGVTDVVGDVEARNPERAPTPAAP